MLPKAVRRAAALALILAWACACPAPAEAPADWDWFPTRYRDCASMYLAEDGRILFVTRTVKNGNPMLAEIECVDTNGTLLWTCPLPPDIPIVFTQMRQNEAGRIALLGKERDGPWHILSVDLANGLAGQCAANSNSGGAKCQPIGGEGGSQRHAHAHPVPKSERRVLHGHALSGRPRRRAVAV